VLVDAGGGRGLLHSRHNKVPVIQVVCAHQVWLSRPKNYFFRTVGIGSDIEIAL
jgi:hypothetical protein